MSLSNLMEFEEEVKEMISIGMHALIVGGHEVPVLNAPYFHSSEAGHIMAAGKPFAACYYFANNKWNFSLRSNDAGVDVGAIAKMYGGGGHRNAAGFAIDSLADL